MTIGKLWPVLGLGIGALLAAVPVAQAAIGGSYSDVISTVQPKIAKIHGAGGFRGLEHYQSGFVVSADGHILTVFSYVLDTDELSVTLHDGRRYLAKLVGADPRLDVAVLKIEAAGLEYFPLESTSAAAPGATVLAFSNLFGVATGDEPASVQHGRVAVKCPLQTRRGAFESVYQGPAYVLDAMTNNPGAAGGALTDRRGQLLGMLGKELRNSLNNTWLNYAIPAEELKTTVEQIIAGTFVAQAAPPPVRPENAVQIRDLGLVLVPDVLQRTPPFVDGVLRDSPAARAGIQPDDLVVFVNGQLVQSCQALLEELARLDRADPVRLTLIRGTELNECELSIAAPPLP